jgi:flagellar L-ring protein precursor FlgH
MRALSKIAAVCMAAMLAGCMASAPKVAVREPTTLLAPPGGTSPGGGVPAQAGPHPVFAVPGAAAPSAGAIFQATSYRGLFEDRRARLVGDILTIQIQEKHSARRSSNSSVDRSGKVEAKVSMLPFASPTSKKFDRLRADGSSDNSFEGKGATGTDNEFNGTITVTVIEVLPNGNLVVSGEKQVGINQNVESLRFSGVVNPATVLPGNVVSSTQVADARLEVRGRGDIDRAQTTGWLSRFFLSFMPI